MDDQQSRREILDSYLTWRGCLGDATQRTLAALLLNRAYLSLWLEHPFNDHRLPAPITITTVANTGSYVLPPYFGRVPPRVREVRNLTTAALVKVVSLDELQQAHPEQGTALESAGTPRYLAVGGSIGVTVQPAAAGQALEVVSSDANDIDVVVVVDGLDSTGQWTETQVILTGQVAVAIGAWQPPLVTFGKAYPAGSSAPAGTSSRGTVTLRVAGAGATLQTLLPDESAREFPSLVLYPKPATAGEIIGLPAIRAPKRLLSDADSLPRFWGEAILEAMRSTWTVSEGGPPNHETRALARLVAFDNSAQRPPRTRPFRG